MEENKLYLIALAFSLIGIFIIFLVGETTDIKQINISDINQNLLNQQIKIIANTTKVKNTPGLLIADIQDSTGNTTMIASEPAKLYLQKNQQIEVIGKIKEYKGKLEIDATQIKFI